MIMFTNTITKGFSAAAIILTVAFFGLTAFASNSPVISDSNRKVAKNQTYTIYWEEIQYGYTNTNYIDSLIIDEDVLHGSLKTISGQYAYKGLVVPAQSTGVAFYYTPNTDFQGADHFKWQATLGGYYSNISSFNFDVIYDGEAHNSEHNSGHNNSGNHYEQNNESTNNYGGGSLNYSDPVDSTNNYNGTGAGGSFLILPTDLSPAPKPELFRTGGFSL